MVSCAVADAGQVFRDESGGSNLSSNAGLKLQLKDVAYEGMVEGISESFLISSTMLCDFLNTAEQSEEQFKHR